MKFPMFFKETRDKKYHNDPFRAVNFKTDSDGALLCPNGRRFQFVYKKKVPRNNYGRMQEVYECEDCSGCPYAERCKKTPNNRQVNLSKELTALHEEVLTNLTDTHGILLRRNRAIQAEGTFGIMKNDRDYQRIVCRGIKSVVLEVILVSIGHNLYKYYHKHRRIQTKAA